MRGIKRFAAAGVVACAACGGDTSGPTDPDPPDTDRPPDVTAPSVQITSPVADSEQDIANSILITGTAADDRGVATVSVTVNNGTAAVATGTSQWSYPMPVTAAGLHSVSVTATDSAGNTSTAATRSFTVLPGWLPLGEPVSGVSDVAIASDNQSLYRFYCVPVENRDEGKLERWSGTAWAPVAPLTNQCHDVDVDVDGTLWVASWADDSPDYGFASNANGPAVSFTGTLLVDQWGMDVTIAQGRPYMTFAARYSDGAPFAYMMLHVISPIPPGPVAKLNGGWGRNVNQSIATDPAIAGDATGWYAVSQQNGFLYVMKGSNNGGGTQYLDIGPGFRIATTPAKPEIVVYQGNPVVTWLEDGQTSLWTARWTGATWELFGQSTVTVGFTGRVRTAARGDGFYVVNVNSATSPAIELSHWDGTQWAALPDPADTGDTPNSSRGDVAVLGGDPVVAYLSGGVMKIKKLLQ